MWGSLNKCEELKKIEFIPNPTKDPLSSTGLAHCLEHYSSNNNLFLLNDFVLFFLHHIQNIVFP